MRRSELNEAVGELYRALTETKLHELVGKAGRKETADVNRELTSQTLEALKDYSIRAHSFRTATKKLVKIFGLEALQETKFWLRFIDFNPTSSRMGTNIRFAVTYLPRVAELFEQETLSGLKRNADRENSPYKNMRVLPVMIYEPENLFSSPTRLANVLESVSHFYTACALLEDESPSTLSVIACDSGSDKSFDFLGLAKVMECVERLIGTIWDRAFFFRERQFEERLELVAKSLPIIERIDAMEKQRQIDPEMAEILRRNVFDGSNKFLQSGATIPRIEDKSEFNPRILLSPVQKLLVAAPDESGRGEEETSDADSDISFDLQEERKVTNTSNVTALTPEEQEQLIRLLTKNRHARVLESTDDADSETEMEAQAPNIDDEMQR